MSAKVFLCREIDTAKEVAIKFLKNSEISKTNEFESEVAILD